MTPSHWDGVFVFTGRPKDYSSMARNKYARMSEMFSVERWVRSMVMVCRRRTPLHSLPDRSADRLDRGCSLSSCESVLPRSRTCYRFIYLASISGETSAGTYVTHRTGPWRCGGKGTRTTDTTIRGTPDSAHSPTVASCSWVSTAGIGCGEDIAWRVMAVEFIMARHIGTAAGRQW